MRSKLAPLALVVAGALGLSCSGDDGADDSVVLPEYCNPLSTDFTSASSNAGCMLPWPSTFYLAQDSATRTGFRVHYPKEAMPKNRDGKVLDNTRFNLNDGFSIGSQPVVFFKQGVSKDGLPSNQIDLSESITDKSLVWIVEHPSGDRVPLFAENDANGLVSEVPALIIRPQAPLKYDTRYIVVLRKGLKDADGAPLEPPEPFARLRDGRKTKSPTLESERQRIEEVLDFLEQQKVARDDVVLAWDFHTASRENVTGNVVGMVDTALSKLGQDGPAFTVTESTDRDVADDPYIMREVIGEMEVPSFLESDDLDAWLKLDGEGKPVYRGMQKFPFYVHIPRCVEQASGPIPVLLFGPGLFSDPKSEFNKEYNRQAVNELCMVQITAQWRGLCSLDGAAVAAQIIPDFSNLPRITDHLQQAHVNYQVLAELAHGGLLKDPAMQVNGKPVTDAQQPMYYLGISNGGIQGVAFAALNKRVERFAFHVSAGWWSQMIQRSSNFALLEILMEKVYPDALDRALMVSLSQHMWDRTDPIGFAGFVQKDPLPGRKAKLVMMQESRYDDQVPNLATRGVARGIGIPQLQPEVEAVYGLTGKSGPLDSGFTQWDTHPPSVPPPENTPPPKPDEEDSAHDRVRHMANWRNQLKGFFKADGKVVNVCSGTCDPD